MELIERFKPVGWVDEQFRKIGSKFSINVSFAPDRGNKAVLNFSPGYS